MYLLKSISWLLRTNYTVPKQFVLFEFNCLFILGQETGNLSRVVENVATKEDCFKLCREYNLCKWFTHIESLSLCSLLVEPEGI